MTSQRHPSYHRGERAVQARAGLLDQAAFGLNGIRSTIPEVAAGFLAGQHVVFLGADDGGGRLWTTMLTGEPGFLRAPDSRTLTVAAAPAEADPLAEALSRRVEVGVIAVEPGTRRRMRINGVARPRDGGLVVEVEQVFANCPKYIQKREPTPRADVVPGAGRSASVLSDEQRHRVTTADTFFVTTASDEGKVDTSHRGGNPGFVHVLSEDRLEWPDYTGNAMFLTLGNLELRPDAGLLFPDWETGTSLHLTGTAAVDWSARGAARHRGAQRVVRFDIAGVVEVPALSPLRWSAPAYSRFNP
ncbi:pyridoxamine 5'-phosphate oxidase family protein [Saccharothrix coeruleofusca]|uniref:Pyridoxamine 5'-phosphate oxidase putative domain-containing protein n=1 Tax=Saccharothrix coeruleofusca TaxID=33919 RepID=A0A918AM51_9PSEU|nr:pyridoxamine 5'-phosphate oxidase family protein [Saccharothrix coeruleofusca]GGP54810.1 hypothetical protein GCM10010185_29150 [Saccharothrix coeruleofusca]